MKVINQNSTRVILADDAKFKSFKIIVSFHTPLGEEYATLNALLLNVLKTSCKKYPSKEKLALALDELYGAQLESFTQKTGGHLLPSLSLDFVSSKYAGEDQLKNAFDLLNEIVFYPDTMNGIFKNDIFEIEKENLIRDIQSLFNDKRVYALQQCLKYTCGDDPYGAGTKGSIEICRNITAERLVSHYDYILTKCNSTIVVVGDFDIDEAEKLSSEFSKKVGSGENIKSSILPKREKAQYINETSEITQGKLVMSFTTDIGEDKKRQAESVLNGIFGGTVSSKLFNVVREKMSLCYYASSRFDKYKGLIIAQCGIDCGNYDKTVKAVIEQMLAVQDGSFTDEEFNNTVSSLTSSSQMVADSLSDLVTFYHNQATSDEVLTPSELIDKYNSVTREQVIELAALIKLNTVYFLCGEKEGN